MREIRVPYNLYIMDSRNLDKMLPQVASLDVFIGASKNFHPNGRFSNEIFGPVGTRQRMQRFAYIDVRMPIMHPLLHKVLVRARDFYGQIMAGKAYATFNPETKDFEKSNVVDGRTGYDFFTSHIKELRLPNTGAQGRQDGLALFEKSRELIMTNKIVMIPAGYRDYAIDDTGRESYDEINNIYYKLIAISNTINPNTARISPEAYNTQRYSLQNSFNELYFYIEDILSGKRGFSAKKWMSRGIIHGTRTVISANVEAIYSLDQQNVPGFNDTVIGLYQTCKAILPVTIYQLRTRFLERVFKSPTLPALITNAETFEAEEIKIPSSTYSYFMSDEGLEKLTSVLEEASLADLPIKIGDHYLGLVYRDGKGNFTFVNGMEEIMGNPPKEHFRPITYAELIYFALYPVANKYCAYMTRYPITGVGSVYPSNIFLKTTTNVEKLQELDPMTNEPIEGMVAYQFPVAGKGYFNSMALHPARLGKLGADHDGDKMSANSVMSLNALNEIMLYNQDARSHVGTDGKFINSMAEEVIDDVLKFLSRER